MRWLFVTSFYSKWQSNQITGLKGIIWKNKGIIWWHIGNNNYSLLVVLSSICTEASWLILFFCPDLWTETRFLLPFKLDKSWYFVHLCQRCWRIFFHLVCFRFMLELLGIVLSLVVGGMLAAYIQITNNTSNDSDETGRSYPRFIKTLEKQVCCRWYLAASISNLLPLLKNDQTIEFDQSSLTRVCIPLPTD